MAVDLRGLALEKAELLSGRLKELLSSGQWYVRAQFGVDLGLEPELYPAWLVLSTAAVALVVLLALSWAALCGGVLLGGKKRGSPVSPGSGEPDQAHAAKTTKAEEQRKKNKKKALEKKTQSNGQPVIAAQEEVAVAEATPKLSPDIRTDKVNEIQSTVPVKKSKKKTKTDVKAAPSVSKKDGKDPDEGAWETMVSNREKRQQRKKDKGPEESGGKGAVDAPKNLVEAPVAAAATTTKKNRGSHDSQQSRATGKGDAASGAVSSKRREEPSVNGGGWVDRSLKIPNQMGTVEGNKWTSMSTGPHYRAQPEPKCWVQDKQGAWNVINSRMKTDRNPVSFSMQGMNNSEPTSNSVDLQWGSRPDVSDEWSGFNGIAAADSSSDWNAPAEHWGNYEEAPVLVTSAYPPKEQPVPIKVSEDKKETEDPAGGTAKSKKKKKKKKNTEEEAAAVAQVVSSVPLINTTPKSQELPPLPSNKQNPSVPSSQKRSEQIAEPSKPSQKKKVRRET